MSEPDSYLLENAAWCEGCWWSSEGRKDTERAAAGHHKRTGHPVVTRVTKITMYPGLAKEAS